jgi:hypothetical protein
MVKNFFEKKEIKKSNKKQKTSLIKNFLTNKKLKNSAKNLVFEVEHIKEEIKKKSQIFYKLCIMVIVVMMIILSYFVILVSTEPKSIAYVTNKVKEEIKKDFGDKVQFRKSYLSFTKYGTIKIIVKDVFVDYSDDVQTKINDNSANKNFAKDQITIPRIDLEFSILDLLLKNYTPKKIKISEADFVVDQEKINNLIASEDRALSVEEKKYKDKISLSQFFNFLKEKKIMLNSIELSEVKISFYQKNQNQSNQNLEDLMPLSADFLKQKEILIKQSLIKIKNYSDKIELDFDIQLKLFDSLNYLELSSSCLFKSKGDLTCRANIENLAPQSISKICTKLDFLNQIDAKFSVFSNFFISDKGFENASFKVTSNYGSFDIEDYFSERIYFSDLSLDIFYDKNQDLLKVPNISSFFLLHDDLDKSDPNSKTLKAPFKMSLEMKNIHDNKSLKSDYFISLQDVAVNEVKKLWPVFLEDKPIRSWVINHLKDGMVKNASTKFSLQNQNNKTSLSSLSAEVEIDNSNLNYSEDFPLISNLKAKAFFSKNDMKIEINDGNVLGSKIYDSKVLIEDFFAKDVILKIIAKSQGHASDSLKHASNSKDFNKKIEKYLNGDSENTINVFIPLSDKLSIENSFIEVNSDIKNLKNEFLQGDLKIAVKKDFGDKNFIAKSNLTKSEISIDKFDIFKKKNDDANLDLLIEIKGEKILLKNIKLTKREQQFTGKKIKFINSSIIGNIEAMMNPFKINNLNIVNKNFGKNSYKLSYQSDKNGFKDNLSISAKYLDLSKFIKNFSSPNKNQNNEISLNINAKINHLYLANNKSLNNFSLSLKCLKNICFRGGVYAVFNEKKFINLRIFKNLKENFSNLVGRISDVGYLAEAFGISNVIADGDVEFEVKNYQKNKKPLFSGSIDLKGNITIFENNNFKKLSSDSLFSSIKDKIFSNNKTTFAAAKIDFEYFNSLIKVNSMIANNYKIGLTAQGYYNLNNNSFYFKGMIVPAFAINNLFGIGKIPLIGSVINKTLTGGEGGGLFGIRYQYYKNKNQKESKFETSKISSFVPTTIKNLFDFI